ncbi:MAG: MFS transporter [Acetobacteraceae bacterium]|nr:MFS transporter [Acetobacteraceae bacterium]
MSKSGPNQALRHATILIAAGVLATTLAQTDVLARLPLQNLLKNELHLDRTANSAFFFWAGLAWYVKPLAGVLTDAFPLFGTRRRGYLLAGASLAALAWAAMGVTRHDYRDLLLTAIVLNVFMVVCSTVIGGYMVETARATAGSGRLTAVRQFVQQGCAIVTGPVAGWLASLAFLWTALACGGVMALLVPVAALFLRERRRPVAAREVLANARAQLGSIATARTMWGAAGLMALFYAAPGFGTAIFYRQQNELHLDTHMQGFLGLIAGVCGVVAAIGYGALCRRLRLRTLLLLCMTLGTAANLGYLFYSSFGRAQLIDGLNGFGYTLAELALMDLAVRATPPGNESLGFALMVSVRNFALFGTDWFGSMLLDRYHVPFDSLVVANSATTAVTVPLVLLLPAAIVGRRDAERGGEAVAAAGVAGLADAKERGPW